MRQKILSTLKVLLQQFQAEVIDISDGMSSKSSLITLPDFQSEQDPDKLKLAIFLYERLREIEEIKSGIKLRQEEIARQGFISEDDGKYFLELEERLNKNITLLSEQQQLAEQKGFTKLFEDLKSIFSETKERFDKLKPIESEINKNYKALVVLSTFEAIQDFRLSIEFLKALESESSKSSTAIEQISRIVPGLLQIEETGVGDEQGPEVGVQELHNTSIMSDLGASSVSKLVGVLNVMESYLEHILGTESSINLVPTKLENLLETRDVGVLNLCYDFVSGLTQPIKQNLEHYNGLVSTLKERIYTLVMQVARICEDIRLEETETTPEAASVGAEYRLTHSKEVQELLNQIDAVLERDETQRVRNVRLRKAIDSGIVTPKLDAVEYNERNTPQQTQEARRELRLRFFEDFKGEIMDLLLEFSRSIKPLRLALSKIDVDREFQYPDRAELLEQLAAQERMLKQDARILKEQVQIEHEIVQEAQGISSKAQDFIEKFSKRNPDLMARLKARRSQNQQPETKGGGFIDQEYLVETPPYTQQQTPGHISGSPSSSPSPIGVRGGTAGVGLVGVSPNRRDKY